MKLWIFAFFAASMISAISTFRELSPYAMFSAMLQSNSMGSWDTMPICARSHWTLKSGVGLPSTFCDVRNVWDELKTFLKIWLCYERLYWKCPGYHFTQAFKRFDGSLTGMAYCVLEGSPCTLLKQHFIYFYYLHCITVIPYIHCYWFTHILFKRKG